MPSSVDTYCSTRNKCRLHVFIRYQAGKMKLNLRLVCFALAACVGICEELEWDILSTERELEYKRCRSGWEEYGDKCYYFSTAKVDWHVAKDLCVKMGGYLVEIDNSDENDYLKNIARRERGENYWTGGNDLVLNGHWFWVHSSSPMRFTDWSKGQPDYRRSKRCVEMHRGFNYKWNNRKCGYVNNFICESYRY